MRQPAECADVDGLKARPVAEARQARSVGSSMVLRNGRCTLQVPLAGIVFYMRLSGCRV